MAVRIWTCRDCRTTGQQLGTGRLRQRCDACNRKRAVRVEQRRRNPLRAVLEDEAPPPAAAAAPAEPDHEFVPLVPAVEDVLAAAPVGGTAPVLRALARSLAAACDGPAARADPRQLVAGVKELRAVLRDLFPPTEPEDEVDAFLRSLSLPAPHQPGE